MNRELLLLLYREMYDEELVRSNGLGADVLLPVGGILVLVTGGVLYHVYNLPWTTDSRRQLGRRFSRFATSCVRNVTPGASTCPNLKRSSGTGRS